MEIFKISAVTGEGIKELLNKVSQELKELPKEDLVEVEKDKKIYELKMNHNLQYIKKEKSLLLTVQQYKG